MSVLSKAVEDDWVLIDKPGHVCKNNIFITETAVAWHFGDAFALTS